MCESFFFGGGGGVWVVEGCLFPTTHISLPKHTLACHFAVLSQQNVSSFFSNSSYYSQADKRNIALINSTTFV